jgi:hypothetical protein
MIDFYTKQTQRLTNEIISITKRTNALVFIRLISFISLVGGVYFSWGNSVLTILVGIIGTFMFVRLVHYFLDTKLKLNKLKTQREVNEYELRLLNGDFSDCHNGDEYLQPNHPFANDLDLFAPSGVFALINKTATPQGKKQLASVLLEGTDDTNFMNGAIDFLSKHIDWTQRYRVTGKLQSREEGAKFSMDQFDLSQIHVPNWMSWYQWVMPIFSMFVFIAFTINLLSISMMAMLLVVGLFPVFRQMKISNLYFKKVVLFEVRVDMLLERLRLIEELRGEEVFFDSLISKVNHNGSSEKELLLLKKQISYINMRLNVLVGLLLNIFFAWDVRLRIGLKKWGEANEVFMQEVENELSLIEVYISGATIRAAFPETTFAQFNSTDVIEIDSALHPLLAVKGGVVNSFSLNDNQQFMILTGPNMAGKSTFLRAIGLSVVFANAGFPVFAKVMDIPKMKLYTSMRTADDINSSSSYFFAELSRLRYIVDAMECQEKVFVLLDEILKGTNSKDKQEGSYKFMKKLQKLGGKGIIATHDLSLCDLDSEQAFVNACFDSNIEADELSFDYTLKSGICQNMNASFLLKKMQLID